MKQTIIRKTVVSIMRTLGYEMIASWRLEDLSFETLLKKLFSTYAIDGVLDVGANRGQYHDFLRHQVGYKGWIVSFEPDPNCIAELMHFAERDDKWIIQPVALGNKTGQLEFNIASDSHFNSFFRPDINGIIIAEQLAEKSKVKNVIQVEVRTLVEYIPLFQKIGIRRPYLKLDTQGFDLRIMTGASHYLEEICALQTEASIRAIYDGMPNIIETIQFLENSGFTISQTFPVSQDVALRSYELDCVAVNSKFADVIG